jgi:hypothetical protein
MSIFLNFLNIPKFEPSKKKVISFEVFKKKNVYHFKKKMRIIDASYGLMKTNEISAPKLKFPSHVKAQLWKYIAKTEIYYLKYKPSKKFSSINELWEFITRTEKWYLEYSPDIKNIEDYIEEITPLIVNTTNELRRRMEFSESENFIIARWDNLILRNKEKSEIILKESKKLTTYCSNCGRKKGFDQRYPKSICHNCSLKLTDLNGRRVEFFNSQTTRSHCQGYYFGTEQKEMYDSELCYINGKEFYAEEARLGGIVIQLKE